MATSSDGKFVGSKYGVKRVGSVLEGKTAKRKEFESDVVTLQGKETVSSAVDVDGTQQTQEEDASGSRLGTSANVGDALVVAIRDLHPQIESRWKLKARVMSEGEYVKWSSWRGDGKLMKFFLLDGNGDTIRATLFNEGVDKLGECVEKGKAFMFSGGKIKVPNRVFSLDACELTFDENSDFSLIPSDEVCLLPLRIKMSTIEQLGSVPIGGTVNTIGIAMDVGVLKRFVAGSGREVRKREVVIVDASMKKIFVTLWGALAEEDRCGSLGQPVLITNGSMNQFKNALSINIQSNSVVQFSPECVESANLKKWYAGTKTLMPSDFDWVVVKRRADD